MDTLQQKLNAIRSAVASGDRASAIEIADTMIVCSAAEQGGGYSGLKILEHAGSARLNRVECFLIEPEHSSLKFFNTIKDAHEYVNGSPIRFTPYAGNALDGGTN